MRSKQDVLDVAITAARLAGDCIRKFRLDANFAISRKEGERNLVTQADLEAEAVILETIRTYYPKDALLTEEAHPDTVDGLLGPLWVIDPVDGTTNFAQGHMHVGVSLAYVENGETQVGVVYAPFLGETFTALRGEGAWLNGVAIRCSSATRLVDALVGTGFPYERHDIDLVVERVRRVLGACRDIRRAGAASLDLCWTACGRLDIFYESLKPWDMAAAALIAHEAGARVGHVGGVPPSAVLPPEILGEELLVAPPALFDDMERLLLVSH